MRTCRLATILRSLLFVGLLGLLASAAAASSPAPRLLSYQGYLAASSGAPVNEPVQMQFRLYDVATGGTALWSEIQTVSVSRGIFSVLLGSVTPLPTDFSIAYWLGMTVGADPEMTPRQLLVGSPYAPALKSCTPSAEICDGIDNNCDGVVDEGFADLGQFCTAGTGACQRLGLKVCSPNGLGTQCNASPGTPQAETCNGIDDNCDGVIDEPFPDRNQMCSVGVGACQRFGIKVCTALGLGTECSVPQGPPGPELCNSIDDNCDGVIDESFPDKNQACFVGTGACQASGIKVCTALGLGTQCNATARSPQPELCNDIDDNCDGSVDEPFLNKNQVCIVGVGACQRAGIFVCSASGFGTQCNVNPGTANPEVCNGIDDNCDGVVDEGCP